MSLLQRLADWWSAAPLPVWYDASYRLPFTTMQARVGFDPRRADLVLWFLEEEGILGKEQRRRSERVAYSHLARVHDAAWLEALSVPETLAGVFALEAWDIQVDPLLSSIRAACGGTVAAAREAVRLRGPTLNLLGGFHHAYPQKGAGMCAVNDIAVAAAVLRGEGFSGRIGVIDLDAHPPDGTAACAEKMGDTWIGSISGVDWGTLPGVDETVIPGAGDSLYLERLSALLERMPPCTLVFVIAGGDVLAGDPLGGLAMSFEGAWERDRRVAEKLKGLPSVWLPGGGYREDAWRLLAGTAWVLRRQSAPKIPTSVDPMALRYARLSEEIPKEQLGSWEITDDDLAASLGLRPLKPDRLLGFYTAAGVEVALHHFGILHTLESLGYHDFRVELLPADPGERLQLSGRYSEAPQRELLVESSLEVQSHGDLRILFVHWLTLRHPKGAFKRPPLPGQQVPGLGMAREAGELLGRMAARLGLAGVGLRPAWLHVAYSARYRYYFVDPEVQGRFEALMRDLIPLFRGASGFDLAAASRATAEGRVWIERDGERMPWRWDPALMLDRELGERAKVEEEKGRVRFGVDPAPH